MTHEELKEERAQEREAEKAELLAFRPHETEEQRQFREDMEDANMATKKQPKIKTFKLSGDILHAGFITVQARTKNEAVRRAQAGDFTIFDEMGDTLGFDWDGGDIEEVG